jgi:hypothetical protein
MGLMYCIIIILGCAVAVERVFSGGRDTVLLQRASLNDVVQQLERV